MYVSRVLGSESNSFVSCELSDVLNDKCFFVRSNETIDS